VGVRNTQTSHEALSCRADCPSHATRNW